MGTKQSCPIKRREIYFESPANYTSFGTRREDELAPTHTKLFHKIHEPFWEELMIERKKDIIAKNKLFDRKHEALERLIQKFINFTAADIQNLRYHFQCFDLNSDGLLDKHELMQILKSSGEKFNMKRVEQCFEVIDEDGSGAIDFEEFLALIHRVRYESLDEGSNDIIKIMQKIFEEETMNKMKNFSVRRQIKSNLF